MAYDTCQAPCDSQHWCFGPLDFPGPVIYGWSFATRRLLLAKWSAATYRKGTIRPWIISLIIIVYSSGNWRNDLWRIAIASVRYNWTRLAITELWTNMDDIYICSFCVVFASSAITDNAYANDAERRFLSPIIIILQRKCKCAWMPTLVLNAIYSYRVSTYG